MIPFIIVGGVALLIGAFVAMPNIPPAPPALYSLNDQLSFMLEQSVHIITYFLTPALTATVLVVFVAVMTGEHIYHGIMWILRKIPVLGIN